MGFWRSVWGPGLGGVEKRRPKGCCSFTKCGCRIGVIPDPQKSLRREGTMGLRQVRKNIPKGRENAVTAAVGNSNGNKESFGQGSERGKKGKK